MADTDEKEQPQKDAVKTPPSANIKNAHASGDGALERNDLDEKKKTDKPGKDEQKLVDEAGEY